jgi:long-chain fatty acid transport protein
MEKNKLKAAIMSAWCLPLGVYATNGMNLEGYGAIARGMGGAAMAYDNGTAAMMNNPATLSLMRQNSQRLDLAIGFLGPRVNSEMSAMPGMSSDSSADAFWIMPAGMGWVQNQGPMSYGLGMFAIGGMGTEYENSFLGLGSGTVRSEVGVARIIAPFSYAINEKLALAATLDYSYAMMDIQMALDGQSLGAMISRGMGADVPAPGTVSGSMVDGMMSAIQGGMMPMPGRNDWARFDFSNDNRFTGKARGGGVAGKLGFVYQVDDNISIGATYHSKTAMEDLSAKNSTVSMNIAGQYIPMTGDIKLKDFQWPAVWALGAAYQMDKWLLAADIKSIRWADVMESFNVNFSAHNSASNGMFAGATMDSVLYQNWKDQTVFSLGASYRINPELTVRAGFNVANNPIPDDTLNFLFPAIVRNHINLGMSYDFGATQGIHFAINYAPEVSQTNSTTGITTSHSQYAWELMYSFKF